ncbi:MAG TPA: pyruvate kinase [Thermoleophilaceae bacterium]|nr:pyruvate kinase [Thermoleophilaceae bacterium]
MSHVMERKTKIVATLGPATDEPGLLDAMVAAGLDCARVNCSHGTTEERVQRASAVRAAAALAGRPVGLLFDLQGPKLRLAGNTYERWVQAGDAITFTSDPSSISADSVAVDFGGFAALVTERSEIIVGDGVPRFAVGRRSDGAVLAQAVMAGLLAPRKGINVTYAKPDLPAITSKDAADLETAVAVGADFIALSFVRSAADIEDLRRRLQAAGSRALIVAKIETVEAYENLDEIIAATDGAMVARGDFGVTAGLARVPLMQKDIISRATQAGKFVITATQMLESMVHAPEPTRAEVADVANAVIDGTSAVMLSAETGVGDHPVEAVKAMGQIAEAAEESPVFHGRARSVANGRESSPAAVMHAAVSLADELGAATIVVPTTTGRAARACAKFRPRTPVLALAYDPLVARQLTVDWGVRPVHLEAEELGDERELKRAMEIAREAGPLDPGDRVVLTGGTSAYTSGGTNVIVVRELA